LGSCPLKGRNREKKKEKGKSEKKKSGKRGSHRKGQRFQRKSGDRNLLMKKKGQPRMNHER